MQDYLNRRVYEAYYVWNAGAGQFSYTGVQKRFAYNGWNMIAELDATAAITKNFFWGLDLSGTAQGAGGVGGLFLSQSGGSSYVPIYDAMGSIHGMIRSADGALVAAYEYDAFGNTIRESGSYAASNPFRYSTKYTDIETGLIYYGHRYYSPSLGRFINKDPIEEMGGLNLYSFCRNNGVNRWDYLGMSDSADTSWRDWHNDTLQLAPITVGRGDTKHGEAIMTQAREGDLMAQANASMAAARIIALGNSSQNFTRSRSGSNNTIVLKDPNTGKSVAIVIPNATEADLEKAVEAVIGVIAPNSSDSAFIGNSGVATATGVSRN